jgi:hypothetical protein
MRRPHLRPPADLAAMRCHDPCCPPVKPPDSEASPASEGAPADRTRRTGDAPSWTAAAPLITIAVDPVDLGRALARP